ncbi:DUF4405 domain-containing protein [Intestinibacter sp.]
MNKKNIFKIVLDIAMMALFMTFFNIGLLGFGFHVKGGMIFGALILVHIIINRKWVANITKRIFDKNLKTRTRVSYLISTFLLVLVCTILVSGICMMKAANYDRVMFWKMLHLGTSYLSIAFIGIHVGLYWNFVSNFFKKMFNIKNSGQVSKIVARIVVVSMLILGAYNIYTQGYFSKVSKTLSYAIEHIVPQDIEVPEGGGHYEKESLSFLGLVNVYGSIVSIFAIGTYYIDSAVKKNKKVSKERIKQAS